MAATDLGDTETFEEFLTVQDLVREALMLGLRTAEGVDLAALARRTGTDPLLGRTAALKRGTEEGDLTLRGDRLCVPTHRWSVLDRIVADLF
jgi:oxygen-independent coproporphyrinogen-3 oxidase